MLGGKETKISLKDKFFGKTIPFCGHGLTLFFLVFLVSCTWPYSNKPSPKPATSVDRSEKIEPRVEPRSKYGNPDSYVVFGRRYYVLPTAKGYVEQGIASWYGSKFHGRRTSSGERYDMYAMTAAHKTLPLPTYARVTNKRNGRSVIVRINDRGPFHQNRIIDLSYAAATKLGIVTLGTGFVEVAAIDPLIYTRANSKSSSTSATLIDVANAEETNSKEPVENKKIDRDLGIFVQIGAFRSGENARKLRSQFAALNIGTVNVQTSQLDGSPIYKVRIGPLDSVSQADDTVAKLVKLGHSDYKLVFEEKT